MSVQSINSWQQQAWADCIRQAKMRNPALVRTKTDQIQADETLQQRFAEKLRTQNIVSQDAQQPKRYTRILGNFFDAYA